MSPRIKDFIHYKNTDFILMLLWLITLVIVAPFGDFPINDDWAYSKNVFHLAVKHEFVLDTFPAMNLISQTLYGSMFVWFFGFSFTILHLSIFILCITSSLVLKNIISKLISNNQWLPLIITCIFFFNPMMLNLSFTFMTDMFFISMVIFTFYFLIRYKESNEIKHYLLFILFCVLGILNRQQGLIISLSSVIFVFGKNKNAIKFILAILPPIVTWLAHDKYRHYLAEFHISNGIKYSGDLFEYLTKAPVNNHVMHAGDSIIIIGLAVLPIVLYQLIPFIQHHKNKLLYFIPVFLLCGYVSLQVWDSYPLGNITYVLSCGPQVVRTDYPAKPEGWIGWMAKLQIISGVISFSMAMLIVAFQKSALRRIHKFFPKLIIAFTVVFFLFVAVSDAYFDRYSIPVILLFILLLIPDSITVFKSKAFVICLGLLYLISVAEVHDYFKWQKVKWNALSHLNQKGIGPDKIDGGFEYNGWHKPTTEWSEPGKSWWWVKDDEYVISTQVLKDYYIERSYIYSKIIPPPKDTLFVLRRITSP